MAELLVFLGWIGTLIYLIAHAYISLSATWIRGLYYTLNLVAASLLAVSSLYIKSYQSFAINLFWMIVSLLLLFSIDLSRFSFSLVLYRAAIMACFLSLGYFVVQGLVIGFIGWVSVFVFCASYFLFTSEKMRRSEYLLWQAFAATAIIPQAWIDSNWPIVGLEVCWAGVSMFGFARLKFGVSYHANKS